MLIKDEKVDKPQVLTENSEELAEENMMKTTAMKEIQDDGTETEVLNSARGNQKEDEKHE